MPLQIFDKMNAFPIALFIIGCLLSQSQAQSAGPCHPYPGAVAQDCLTLIGNHLNNDTSLGIANIKVMRSLGSCSIVAVSSVPLTIDEGTMARRALTAMGACALSDLGSVSGYYTDPDGSKVCYLYPGQ
jgi:hypothetical protein